MTRIRGGQMVLSIDHNNTVHLIKMTLSRRGKHILWVQIQNSKAAVRKRVACCAINVQCLFNSPHIAVPSTSKIHDFACTLHGCWCIVISRGEVTLIKQLNPTRQSSINVGYSVSKLISQSLQGAASRSRQ